MSIKNKALKVGVTIRKPQMTQKDNKATHDAEAANNARNAGQYRKDLYPKHLTQPISTLESSVRAYIKRITYSYGDYQILPTTRFMDFADTMATYELQFKQQVTAFLNNWANVMHEAKLSQGDLFDAAAYPDLEDLRNQFVFRMRCYPITDSDAWTDDFDMSEDELEIVRQQTERETIESINDMMREPLERLRKVVAHLHEVTGKEDRVVTNKKGYDEVKPPIFRDSVVDNIADEIDLLMDFADIMPENVLNVAKEVLSVTPAAETLRNSPDVRKETNTKTAALLASLDDMLFEE